MLLTSSGFMSLFMKLEKYGVPYLAVISKIFCETGESQSKSDVMLYVGIGKCEDSSSCVALAHYICKCTVEHIHLFLKVAV